MTTTAPPGPPSPAAPPRPVAVPPATKAPRPRRASDDTASVASSAFAMLAVVSVWVIAQMLVLGGLSQQRDQDLLYGQLRTELASATAPIGPIVPVGDPVALISIPAIGVEQVVVEGTASGDTLAGPGHRRDTVLPGQAGTSVVYGRAATYGAPFADITALSAGDTITVVMAQGQVDFEVLDVRHAGEPLPQPATDGAARLTLVTAEGEGRLARVTPDAAVYVDAEAKQGFPAPPGRPVAVPESEKAMAWDPGALPLLALDLALLIALTLAVVAARQRWPAALVWVVASPLVIALAWATTDEVMRLLPNLI